MSARRRRLGAVVALVVLLAGCGIPRDDAPRAMSEEPVTSTTSTTEAGTGTATVVLPVAETRKLVTRDRRIDGAATPATVLDALLMEPSEQEVADGLTTFIPPATEALSVEEVDGVWVVTMNGAWGELQGTTALYAYAQVVLTLTQRPPSVERVRFVVEEDGEAVPVVEAPTDSRGAREVLTADDYRTLAPG